MQTTTTDRDRLRTLLDAKNAAENRLQQANAYRVLPTLSESDRLDAELAYQRACREYGQADIAFQNAAKEYDDALATPVPGPALTPETIKRSTAASSNELHTAVAAASKTMTCPECLDDVEYEPPQRAEPDTGLAAFPGGYACGCGWKKLDN